MSTTQAAQFWGLANGVGTWSPHRNIAEQHGESLADNARMFAMVYRRRRQSPNRGRSQLAAVVATPPYPDQPSGLSALGGASARALREFFGSDDVAFTGTITNAQGTITITRNYASVSQAASEIVDARVWAGIHFRKRRRAGRADR